MAAPKKTTAGKTAKNRAAAKKPKLSLEPVDGPVPEMRRPTADQLECLGPNGGWFVCESGRIVAALGDAGSYEIGYLDPGWNAPRAMTGVAVAHGAPHASADGQYAIIVDKQRKALIEIDLDNAVVRTVYEYGHAMVIIPAYVRSDVLCFLWGDELFTLFRQDDGSWVEGEIVRAPDAFALTRFGQCLALAPELHSTKKTRIVMVKGTNVEIVGELALDRRDVELRDGRAIVSHARAAHAIEGLVEIWNAMADRPPLRATGYDGPLPAGGAGVGPPPERLKTEFPEAKSLLGTTPGGRDLGWIPGAPPSFVWRDTDGSRRTVEDIWNALPSVDGTTWVGTYVHPTQDRIMHYMKDRPFDITFDPPRARIIGDAGARAVYAGENRIVMLMNQTLHLLDDDLNEIASLPCPDHDVVFVVRWGRDVLTGGPSTAPRIYDIADELSLRGELPATSASKAYAKKLKETGGALAGVREVRSGYGRVFVLTRELGNFELQGL
jgi:hypothetical protein